MSAQDAIAALEAESGVRATSLREALSAKAAVDGAIADIKRAQAALESKAITAGDIAAARAALDSAVSRFGGAS